MSPKVEFYRTILSVNQADSVTNCEVDIYYPVPEGNSDFNIYPLALLLQGLNADKSRYSEFARRVASYGFVVAVPNHCDQKSGAKVLQVSLENIVDIMISLKSECNQPHSPIFYIVDKHKIILLGHSAGGAVGLRAIQPNSPIRKMMDGNELISCVFYSTSGESIDNSEVPILLISGSEDQVIPVRDVVRTYHQIKTAPKVCLIFKGANHNCITNDFPPRGTSKFIRDMIATWTGLFLLAYLHNHPDDIDDFYSLGKSSLQDVELLMERLG